MDDESVSGKCVACGKTLTGVGGPEVGVGDSWWPSAAASSTGPLTKNRRSDYLILTYSQAWGHAGLRACCEQIGLDRHWRLGDGMSFVLCSDFTMFPDSCSLVRSSTLAGMGFQDMLSSPRSHLSTGQPLEWPAVSAVKSARSSGGHVPSVAISVSIAQWQYRDRRHGLPDQLLIQVVG